MQLYSKLVHVKFMKATLGSSEVGARISARDCGLGLVFQRLKTGKPRLLQGYIDADYAGDLNQRKSTTGYMFTVAECVIS